MLNETSILKQYYTNNKDIIEEIKKTANELYGDYVIKEHFMDSGEVCECGEYYNFEVVKENNIIRPPGIYWAVDDLIDGEKALIKSGDIIVVGKYKHTV